LLAYDYIVLCQAIVIWAVAGSFGSVGRMTLSKPCSIEAFMSLGLIPLGTEMVPAERAEAALSVGDISFVLVFFLFLGWSADGETTILGEFDIDLLVLDARQLS
jgi:hypothetical protein